MNDPIVVSGIGVVCSVAIGRGEFWEALSLGATGVDVSSEEARTGEGPELVAEAMDFDIDQYLPSEKNYLDRHSELGFAATKLALDDAKLALPCEDADRVGLALGTCWGNPDTMMAFYGRAIDKGPKFAPPILFPHAYPNATDSLLSIEYEIKGPNVNFTSGMAAGGDALAWALECVRRDRADLMLVAGIDALSQFVVQSSCAAGWCGSDGAMPFHDGRSGFVPGEAGAVVLIEPAERAIARGAAPVAEILGCGQGAGAELAGRMEAAMTRAMADAGVEEVDAVFAAANGSPALDEAEATALKNVFGERISRTPVTALKAALGETFAAACPLHCAAAGLSLAHGLLPPTAEVEPGHHLIPLLGEAHQTDARTALVNVADPGGSAMSVVLRKLA